MHQGRTGLCPERHARECITIRRPDPNDKERIHRA